MSENTGSGQNNKKTEFDQNVDRALSLLLHHPEVQQMAEIIKKIHEDRE